MGECTITDLHASDLKIQINNPLMSYKGRHIGRIPGTKRSISTFDFKPTYDFLSRSSHINQMIDTPSPVMGHEVGIKKSPLIHL